MAQETGASPCDTLARLQLPATTVTEARAVEGGTFAFPPAPFTGRDISALYKSLPPFCRVSAVSGLIGAVSRGRSTLFELGHRR
jgi:hypothetical protein